MGQILVTGGAGYIGSVVTELLVESGREPVVVDNLAQGHATAILPGVAFVEADLKDRPSLNGVFRSHDIEAVIHLAGLSVVGDSVREPLRYYAENLGGLFNLLEAMQSAGVKRMVFSSSAAVYAPASLMPITETCPVGPINPYGRTKLIAEQLLADCNSSSGFSFASLRYFNVAGASERFGEAHDPETHLIPRVLDVARGERPHVEVYGTDYDTPDGTCIRDYIHVVDLAEAHLLALEKTAKDSAVYNLGNGRGYSVMEVIQCVSEITGREIPWVRFPRRAGDPSRLVASYEKIHRELGWRPRRDLRTMIASAWRLAEQEKAFVPSVAEKTTPEQVH